MLTHFSNKIKKIKPATEIEYSNYPKIDGFKASFSCHHNYDSWPELVYNLILIIQNSARQLILSELINETIDIFSKNISGAVGGISSLHVTCIKEDSLTEKNAPE